MYGWSIGLSQDLPNNYKRLIGIQLDLGYLSLAFHWAKVSEPKIMKEWLEQSLTANTDAAKASNVKHK